MTTRRCLIPSVFDVRSLGISADMPSPAGGQLFRVQHQPGEEYVRSPPSNTTPFTLLYVIFKLLYCFCTGLFCVLDIICLKLSLLL